MDCIFCRIIAGDIRCEKVYEDSHVLAFLDITPVNPGHTLVVPKEHYADMAGTPVPVLIHLIEVVQKVGNAVLKSGLAQGFNVGLNNGAAAGQSVLHTHFHIVPRNVNDGHSLWHGKKYVPGQATAVAAQLRRTML